MPMFQHMPIMPKESKAPMPSYAVASTPYPTATTGAARNAAIWSTADDEILLTARASGLNWQPIASRHFPNKTANACRKRHERLIERRHVEDWDAEKLELLAREYLAVRKEMWEILASRLGERWGVVESKVSHPTQCPTLDISYICSSAWKRVSRLYKQRLARHSGRLQQVRATHTVTKVPQTIIATLALG